MTRGELQEELKQFKQELKQELRLDLEIWGGALLDRIDRIDRRLGAELARHAGALQESMSALFAARDEQYADLPGRVSRLEATVFAPKRR